MSPTLRDVSPLSLLSFSRSFFFSPFPLLLLLSVVPMENVTERRRKVGRKGISPSLLSLSHSSHLHLGNAAIHNSSVVQFGRFSEYVIAPSYAMSFTFPRRFCSPALFCLSLFLALRHAASTLRPASRRDDASCRQCIIDITSRRCRPDLNNSPIDRSIDRYVIS